MDDAVVHNFPGHTSARVAVIIVSLSGGRCGFWLCVARIVFSVSEEACTGVLLVSSSHVVEKVPADGRLVLTQVRDERFGWLECPELASLEEHLLV